MSIENVLETRNLSFAYHGQIVALKDVTISIPKGKKNVVLGPNGAGKSTLFFHFNGVLRPKKGSVLYEGSPISYRSKDLARLRQDVAVVLQDPDDQILSVTVEEDIAFGPINIGLNEEEIVNRVEEALFIVGMEDLRERPVQHLSFGQRKRVSLAGALAMRPKVLIMDEPTAGFDPQMVQWFLELADELNKEGITMVISTHDVNIAYEWTDQLHVLKDGELKFSGNPEEFFSDEYLVNDYGLTTPTLFELNRWLNVSRGIPEAPYPHNLMDMLFKVNPREGFRPGTLFVRPVEREESLLRLPEYFKFRGKVGVHGTRAKRLAVESGIKIDFLCNGIEHCLREVMYGREALLLAENAMLEIVHSRIRGIERRYGQNIPVVTLRNFFHIRPAQSSEREKEIPLAKKTGNVVHKGEGKDTLSWNG